MGQRGSEMVPIERIEARAYEIPTDRPEADGTLEWDSTAVVVVELTAGGKRGLGYTYADASVAHLIHRILAEELKGHDVMDVPARMASLLTRVRNLGRPGLGLELKRQDAERYAR
ncbi:hypothetical protein BO221_45760 [Archangium sp. Cb G35]|nr:hypothetical protein BO221_45760 [Archangium sp. Cb G35]